MNDSLPNIGPLEILVNFLPGVWRTVRRGGIELWALGYWHDDLGAFVGCNDPQLIYYDPRDITRVYVRAPDGLLRECTVLDPDIKRMSLTEWRRQRKQKLSSADDPSLDELKDLGIEKKEELERKSKRETLAARRIAAREGERTKSAASTREMTSSSEPECEREPAEDGPVPIFGASFLKPQQSAGDVDE